MKQEYEAWLKRNAPAGRAWTGKLLPRGAAVAATVVVGLAVVMMAGLGLPPGELPAQARGPAAAPQQAGQTVRYAEALPTVTVVGRREPATAAVLPARPVAGDAATVGIAAAGHNLGQ